MKILVRLVVNCTRACVIRAAGAKREPTVTGNSVLMDSLATCRPLAKTMNCQVERKRKTHGSGLFMAQYRIRKRGWDTYTYTSARRYRSWARHCNVRAVYLVKPRLVKLLTRLLRERDRIVGFFSATKCLNQRPFVESNEPTGITRSVLFCVGNRWRLTAARINARTTCKTRVRAALPPHFALHTLHWYFPIRSRAGSYLYVHCNREPRLRSDVPRYSRQRNAFNDLAASHAARICHPRINYAEYAARLYADAPL